MFSVPTRLPLPLPDFLTREYVERVTPEEIFAHEEFVRFMSACDELVTTSDESSLYLDMFAILMGEEKCLAPTDRNFAAAAKRGKNLPVAAERLERGLELCMASRGPNEALPNLFAAYQFTACVRGFARSALERLFANGQLTMAVTHRCESFQQLAVMTFLLAVKVQLGIDPPASWPRIEVEDVDRRAKAPAGEPEPDHHSEETATATSPGVSPEASKGKKGWTLWTSTNLLGKANIVLSWYWDGDTDGDADEHWLRDAMKVVRMLIEGKNTAKIRSDQWFAAYDALASFPEPDQELSNLRRLVEEKYDAAVKAEQPPDRR